jgi:hypothetical protein
VAQEIPAGVFAIHDSSSPALLSIADCRLPIADCRLKKRCGELLRCQPAIENRQSTIPAIVGQTLIVEILPTARRISQIGLQRRSRNQKQILRSAALRSE